MLNENKWLSPLLLGSVVENPMRIMFADSELGVCDQETFFSWQLSN